MPPNWVGLCGGRAACWWGGERWGLRLLWSCRPYRGPLCGGYEAA